MCLVFCLCWWLLWLSMNKWATGNVLCAPRFPRQSCHHPGYGGSHSTQPCPTSTPAGAEAQGPPRLAGPCPGTGPPTSPAGPPAFSDGLWGPVPTPDGWTFTSCPSVDGTVLVHVDGMSWSPESWAGTGHSAWASCARLPGDAAQAGSPALESACYQKHWGLENRPQPLSEAPLPGDTSAHSQRQALAGHVDGHRVTRAPAHGGAAVPRGTHW